MNHFIGNISDFNGTICTQLRNFGTELSLLITGKYILILPFSILHVFEHFNLTKPFFCLLASWINPHISATFRHHPVAFFSLLNHTSSVPPPKTFFHYFKSPPAVGYLKQTFCCIYFGRSTIMQSLL